MQPLTNGEKKGKIKIILFDLEKNMNKFAIFFRKYGHKIFTFCIGLAFLAGCAFLAFLGVNRVYHLFKPEHIYEEGVNSDLIWKGAPFDELRASGTEAGTAEFFERYIANYIKQDFPSYTNTLELNTDYFISYGIWQAIAVNGQGIYANQGDGSFLVPKEDVEKYARLNFDFVGDLEFHDVEICGAFNYIWIFCCSCCTIIVIPRGHWLIVYFTFNACDIHNLFIRHKTCKNWCITFYS